MNVASLDRCRELYELSGWKNPKPDVFDIEKAWRPTPLTSGDNYRLINIGPNTPEDVPAYDLGYLLRKLDGFDVRLFYSNDWRQWYCANDSGDKAKTEHADSPEDAACKLATEPVKQGVLAAVSGGNRV